MARGTVQETKKLHAQSYADFVSSQRETHAQLLAAQQSVVDEQAKACEEQRANREAHESPSLKLLEDQKELEASRKGSPGVGKKLLVSNKRLLVNREPGELKR